MCEYNDHLFGRGLVGQYMHVNAKSSVRNLLVLFLVFIDSSLEFRKLFMLLGQTCIVYHETMYIKLLELYFVKHIKFTCKAPVLYST